MSQRVVRRLLRTPISLLDKIGLTYRYFNSSRYEKNCVSVLDDIESFCLFIGYPRSGHSLIGSLIDAHPNAVIAHELDVLKYFQAGFSKNQVYYLILENSRKFTLKGRKWTGYSYRVSNQWQGKYSTLKIIGDKKGGKTTERLVSNPDLLEEFRDIIDSKLKLIHVIRNPYDNISRMSIVRQDKTQNDLIKTINEYFLLATTVQNQRKILKKGEILDIYLESIIQDPITVLNRIANFL